LNTARQATWAHTAIAATRAWLSGALSLASAADAADVDDDTIKKVASIVLFAPDEVTRLEAGELLYPSLERAQDAMRTLRKSGVRIRIGPAKAKAPKATRRKYASAGYAPNEETLYGREVARQRARYERTTRAWRDLPITEQRLVSLLSQAQRRARDYHLAYVVGGCATCGAFRRRDQVRQVIVRDPDWEDGSRAAWACLTCDTVIDSLWTPF
jgi:hypothetical protein